MKCSSWSQDIHSLAINAIKTKHILWFACYTKDMCESLMDRDMTNVSYVKKKMHLVGKDSQRGHIGTGSWTMKRSLASEGKPEVFFLKLLEDSFRKQKTQNCAFAHQRMFHCCFNKWATRMGGGLRKQDQKKKKKGWNHVVEVLKCCHYFRYC